MLVTNQRDRDVTWMLRIELIFCNIVFEKILSDQFFVSVCSMDVHKLSSSQVLSQKQIGFIQLQR